jgi:hypothetical protein
MTTQQQTTENFCISATSFSPKKDVSYTKPRVNKSGGKSIGILNKKTNKQLMLSTPLMLTWGANKFVDEATGRVSYDMALQFPSGDYATEETTQFLEAMDAFQSKLKSDAVANSKEWLNKSKMSEEVVDALFHPMLKYSKDKNTGEPDYTRSPSLKLKLDFWDSAFNCEIYDLEQKQIFPSDNESVGPCELIAKGVNVACVIKCGGLWFANGKFGCTWKLEQAVVKPRASYKGRCLINLSSEETQRLKSQKEPEDEEETSVGLELADDSDDEDASAAAVDEPVAAEPVAVVAAEPVAAAPTKTVKKIVRRKKPAE